MERVMTGGSQSGADEGVTPGGGAGSPGRPSRGKGRAWRLLAGVGIAGLVLAACSSGSSTKSTTSTSTSSSTTTGAAVNGGTVTFAEQPATPPNYIFPLMPSSFANSANIGDFQFLLYRPLYWFGMNGVPEVFNPRYSLASRPVYSNGDKTVTITLKNYVWSDGAPVTNRDIEFWVNLVKAERQNWFAYVPGEFPDNIVGMKLVGTKTIVFQLSHAYSPHWFTHNQLSQITPLPQHAWDKTSATGTIGNYDLTTAGARKVYAFLAGQAKDLATYGTNPLWRTVDGPFVLTGYTTEGQATFVPNTHYSGLPKPKIAKLIELPFTTDTAEYNEVEAGQITYGYIPTQDLGQHPSGYTIAPWYGWQIGFVEMNEHNPKVGPMLSQLYVRQALQHLVNQPGIVASIYRGYAVPDYGPVPIDPTSSLTTAFERKNPYPFSVSATTSLLRAHGWSVHPLGVDTCAKPGTGPGECGAGIPAGAPLTLSMIYPSGVVANTTLAAYLHSTFSEAGITLNVAPSANVLGTAVPCTATQASCSWQLVDFGSVSWFYGNDNYPTGGQLFATGASFNLGGYSNPTVDAQIQATHVNPSVQALYTYEDTIATQLPVLFQPVTPLQVSAIKDNLAGALPQNTILNLNPEKWYFTK
jgi:peptide/nickel transport system substrate-binding protein